MGDFLPGVFRMIEERFGRAGRPLTTFLLAVFALAIIAWCLGLIYNNVVGPILSALGKEVAPVVIEQTIAWATLLLLLGGMCWLIAYVSDRLQGRRFSTRLQEQEEEIRQLREKLESHDQEDSESR